MHDLPHLTAAQLEMLAGFSTNGHVPAGDVDEFWERDAVPTGERNNALTALAGFAREHPLWRLSYRGLQALLAGAPLDIPLAANEVRTIAGSVAKYAVGTPSFEIAEPPAGIRLLRGDEVEYVGPPVQWWVPGFIPRGELVMLFGPKAAGKSTFASWLAGPVTAAGGKFLHIGLEEPFSRFLARAVMGGADRTNLLAAADPGAIHLPGGVEPLAETILRERIDVVYFDAIYSHFEAAERSDAAFRARRALSPLASLAQNTGATVLGVFHDRRADGDYMGSTEMINVARVILHLTREANQAPRLRVRTTNFTHPEAILRLHAVDKVVADDEGNVQMETGLDGELQPLIMKVVERAERASEGLEGATAAELERPKEQAKSRQKAFLDELTGK